MRATVARALVRWSSRSWDAGYEAYVRRQHHRAPAWWDRFWNDGARRVEKVAIPIARKLDPEATGQQMVESGWWG